MLALDEAAYLEQELAEKSRFPCRPADPHPRTGAALRTSENTFVSNEQQEKGIRRAPSLDEGYGQCCDVCRLLTKERVTPCLTHPRPRLDRVRVAGDIYLFSSHPLLGLLFLIFSLPYYLAPNSFPLPFFLLNAPFFFFSFGTFCFLSFF